MAKQKILPTFYGLTKGLGDSHSSGARFGIVRIFSQVSLKNPVQLSLYFKAYNSTIACNTASAVVWLTLP